MTTISAVHSPPARRDNHAGVATTSTRWPFARHAGPLALRAGALIVVAQLIMLPFDPKDHVPTSQDVVFQAGGVVYMVGFCVLMFAVIGTHGWQAHRAGRPGTVALATAVVGTMMLGGDLWFETFVMSWIADSPSAAQTFDTDPSALLAVGAFSSYVLFAVGWALFGIASFRARVFPSVISVLWWSAGSSPSRPSSPPSPCRSHSPWPPSVCG